jgi:hypothetical protein
MENKTENNGGIQDYGPEAEAAREWLDIGDKKNDEPTTSNSKDILWIIKNCLKEVKKLKTECTIKVMTQLICCGICKAAHPLPSPPKVSKTPHKCQYFVRQIHENKAYLL